MANKVGAARLRQECEQLRVWRSPGLDGFLFSRGTHFKHPYPRHWHDEIHFCAYTAGSGYLGYRGNSHRVSKGDLIITPPGEVHENWVASDSDISFCGAYVDVVSFRKALTDLTGRELPLPFSRELFSRDKGLKRSFLLLLQSADSEDSVLHQEELLFDFLRRWLLGSATAQQRATRLGNERTAVKRAKAYIDAHFTESISLASLGELTNLSPYHLHRVFSQKTGMPPHAYQTQVRINRAKQLLRDRLPLSAVAADTGFADQSHLTRHFRRLVGLTPGRFLA